MGRYNANEPRKLTKTFSQGQKKQEAVFKDDSEEAYWLDMSKFHGEGQILAMRKVKDKSTFDQYVRKFLSRK